MIFGKITNSDLRDQQLLESHAKTMNRHTCRNIQKKETEAKKDVMNLLIKYHAHVIIEVQEIYWTL